MHKLAELCRVVKLCVKSAVQPWWLLLKEEEFENKFLSNGATQKVCQILLKIRKRLNFGGISKMHNCCCIVKNRICVGLFAKQPPRVANDVETVTRIFKTLCQKLTYVMCRKKHHNFLCVHKQPSSAKRGICNLSDLITYSRLMIVLTKTFT